MNKKKAVIVTAWIQKGRGQLRSAHGLIARLQSGARGRPP